MENLGKLTGIIDTGITNTREGRENFRHWKYDIDTRNRYIGQIKW